MKYFLIVAKGRRQGMPIPVAVDLFLVGKDPLCQLHADHDSIGEQHCAFLMRERKVFLNDMDSGFPTLVNDQAIPPGSEWPLHSGDLVEIGPLRFMVQLHERHGGHKDTEEWALKCLDHDHKRKIHHDDHRGEVDEHSEEFEGAASAAASILSHLNEIKGEERGHLRISREQDLTVIRVNEHYLVEDAELAMIKKELHNELDKNNLKVLLDLKNVRRMSSQAIEMVGELQHFLKKHNSKMAVCRVRSELLSMLQSFPTTSRVPHYRDHAAAHAGRW